MRPCFTAFALTLLFALTGSLPLAPGLAAAEGLSLKDGDVIALVGGSHMERTRLNAFLQTLIRAAHPDRALHVRNLGWEGDTVFEQWMVTGGEKWRRDRDWETQLASVKPTVVFVNFGQMEALQGREKLPDFIEAYEALLDTFVKENRRVVLLSPVPFEATGEPNQPDLSRRNSNLKVYVAAIRIMAEQRTLPFIDLFSPLLESRGRRPRHTDNGYQLNESGHRLVAEQIAEQLGWNAPPLSSLEPVRQAALEVERVWFDYWRPMNWGFLAGDRTHVPYSHDWRDPEKRIFPEEMKAFLPLLDQAESNVARALQGKDIVPIVPTSPIPDAPPILPSQSPEQELATLKILEPFQLNLFASEADGIMNPIQMRWDERGRLWVACTVSYPQIKPGEKANDRIVICEDTDRDGRADTFTTFVDGLFMPTGLELGDGGLYVAEGTELRHYRDTDGDDVADENRLLLGGFGTADSHQMLNCLSWGFGGEMWLSQGHHIYSRVETPYGVEILNRAGVWRWRPRTMRLDPFFQMSSAGANIWGVLTLPYGQVFHKSGATIGGYYSTPGLIRSELPLSGEPLRLFHHRAKQVGIDIIESTHFPPEMQGRVVVGGYYDSTLQWFDLEYDAPMWKAPQLPLLVETTNTVFRPVDVHVGPDGAVYFADWYNSIIGHYQASYKHPDRDKTHGRIWRLTMKGRPMVTPPKLTGLTPDQLFDHLDSPERWVKRQAKRLLFEADTEQVSAMLDRRVAGLQAGREGDEYLRLQALGVYEGHELLRPGLVRSLLQSPDYRVRAYATRAVGHFANQLRGALGWLDRQVQDPHPMVRLEAVVACTYLSDPRAVAVLTKALDQPVGIYLDHALTKAVNATRPNWEKPLLDGRLKFAKDAHWLYALRKESPPGAAAFLRDKLSALGTSSENSSALLGALAAVGDGSDIRWVFDRSQEDPGMLEQLAEASAERNLRPTGEIDATLQKLLDPTRPDLQHAAIQLAGAWKTKTLTPQIKRLALQPDASPETRLAALDSLASLQGPAAAPVLLQSLEAATDPRQALAALEILARIQLQTAADFVREKLDHAESTQEAGTWLLPITHRTRGPAVLAEKLSKAPLKPAQARLALSVLPPRSRGGEVLRAALQKQAGLSGAPPAKDETFVRELAAEVRSLGDSQAGARAFQSMGCAACHAVNGQGGPIGPELSALSRGLPLEGIIIEVLWPAENVKEGYAATTVTTRDGRIVEGFKEADNAREIVIRDMLTGNPTAIHHEQVLRVQTGGSVMPEGLASAMPREDLVNLIRYLSELGK